MEDKNKIFDRVIIIAIIIMVIILAFLIIFIFSENTQIKAKFKESKSLTEEEWRLLQEEDNNIHNAILELQDTSPQIPNKTQYKSLYNCK